MIPDHLQEEACLFVLGSLGPAERKEFEQRLHAEPGLKELVRQLERAILLTAKSIPAAALPTALKQKVLDQISQAAAAKQTPTPASFQGRSIPGFTFEMAADPSGWKQLPIVGAWIKVLSLHRDTGYAVLLGRLEPGVAYPPHYHPGPEDLFIISGDLHIGDRELGPGDFHHADAGTSHPINRSVHGCQLMAVLPVDHELVQLALA